MHRPIQNHKFLYVSLEILVRAPLEKQLDQGGSCHRLCNTLMTRKKPCQDPPPTDFSGSQDIKRSLVVYVKILTRNVKITSLQTFTKVAVIKYIQCHLLR